MSEGNRTPTRHFVEIGYAHVSAESANDVEDNLQSQILERKLSSNEVDERINAIVAALATQLEKLIQSVRELDEGSSNRLNGTWRPNNRYSWVSVPISVFISTDSVLIFSQIALTSSHVNP